MKRSKGGRSVKEKSGGISSEQAGKLVKIFSEFDHNGDGVISEEELRTVFKAIDPVHWNDARITQLLKEADTNGDGRIEYAEFVAWITSADQDTKSQVMVQSELKAEKSFDASTLIADCRATAGMTEQYQIKLEQGHKTKMGVKIDASDGRMLVIKGIQEGGLIAKWNEESTTRQVNVGDMIVGVNGRTGSARDIMAEFANPPSRGYRTLTLTLQPKDTAYRFIHKLADNYDVDVAAIDEDDCSSMRYAVHRTTKLKHCVKSVHKKSSRRVTAEAEIEAMKRLDHPNVLKLYQVFEDFHDIHLVLERCTGGELLERVLQEERFSERQAAVVMQQIFGALEHLRSRKICHRDVRPENVLLQEDVPIERAIPKLTGFGCAKSYDQSPARFSSQVGDVMYKSPQMIEGMYDETCDIWSAGVMMYLLISGYAPFYGETDYGTSQLVLVGSVVFPDEDWKDVSPQAIDLLTRLLSKPLDERCSLEQALQHDWTQTRIPQVAEIKLDKGQQNMRRFCGASKLKKAALHALAQRLSESELEELKHMFKLLDANGDSMITMHELKTGLDRLGQKESWDDLKRIVEEVDVDGSKRIDYTEFLAATMSQRRVHQEDTCWAVFSVFDRDGNGRIGKHELMSVLHSGDVQAVMGKSQVDKALEEFDENGDGEIDFNEFMAMMRGDQEELDDL